MLIHIAYKYRIYPNKSQQIFFAKTFGCCRKIWNLLLNDYNKTGQVNSKLTLYKEIYPYLRETDSLALSAVWKYFSQAINAYKSQIINKPRFKKKNSVQSYTTSYTNNNIRLEGIYNPHKIKQRIFIRLPKIDPIKLVYHRPLPYGSTIKHVTVTKTMTNQYYISINVEYDNQVFPKVLNINNSVGLDYSLSQFIVSSDNIQYNYKRNYREYEKRLAKYQKLRDKASKGSKKKAKFTMKLRKLHQKIDNKRNDFLHKTSCDLSRKYDFICIENLDLKSMANSHGKYHLGKSVYDTGYYTFKTFLQYKLLCNGNKCLIVIDRYYPSTQLCSYCGYKNTNLRNNLSIREWKCPNCHTYHDRDYNAAKNILNRGIHLWNKYLIYMNKLQQQNILINDYILNKDILDPLIYPVMQLSQGQYIPPTKIPIVDIISLEQRDISQLQQNTSYTEQLKQAKAANKKLQIVYIDPPEQRKKINDGSNAFTATTTTTTTTTSQKTHIVEQVPLELRKKID